MSVTLFSERSCWKNLIKRLLKPVSKGVYFIGEKPVDEELIFDEYVDDGKGMFVGYQLFNDVGISNYIDCKIEI